MKRWLRRILIALFLGALSTYLIAWALVVFSPNNWGGRMVGDVSREERHITWWREHAPEMWPRNPGFVIRVETPGYTFESYYDALYNNQTLQQANQRMFARRYAGWPRFALEGWSIVEPTPAPGTNNTPAPGRNSTPGGEQLIGLLPLDLGAVGGAQHHRLPLRPMFPGFLINTLLGAAFWFALLFGFSTIRAAIRFRRTQRGRCPTCGYNLQNKFNDGCPECGWGRDA